MLFPTSIANSLIAVGTDGLQERDRMVRAAIAIVCELGEYITVPPIAHLVPGPLLRISPPLSLLTFLSLYSCYYQVKTSDVD